MKQGRGEKAVAGDKWADKWVPRVVVGIEFVIWRLTDVGKLGTKL